MRATLPRLPSRLVFKHSSVIHINAALTSKTVSLKSSFATPSAITRSHSLQLVLLIHMLCRNIQQARHSHCLALQVCLNPLGTCHRRAYCRSNSTNSISHFLPQDSELLDWESKIPSCCKGKALLVKKRHRIA